MTDPTAPTVLRSVSDLRNELSLARENAANLGGDGRVVLVPTMGALHAGHLALVERALELGDIVVVSVFVNPLQFGAGEDLDTYPRTLDEDVAQLATLGVPFVYAPPVEEMYPGGPSQTRVTAGHVGTLYEGASRPGHFDGMLTVVAKLFNIVGPDMVVFGQKDAQQVFLVERMVADLNMDIAVEVGPTVRELSGLALSSRNRNLNADEHAAALALSAALDAGQAAAERGALAAVAAARAVIDAQPLVKLDYLVVVHPSTFLPVDPDHRGPARMLVAALVGRTRLIDNVALDLS